MTIEKLRALCLSLPGGTEQIQWGYDLVFKVGGKMFCVTPPSLRQPCSRSSVTMTYSRN